MTAIPPATRSLVDSIRRLDRTMSYSLRFELKGLTSELKNTFSPLQNLSKAFGASEGLQKKALSINSNLLKVTTTNSESLKKMRGDFFDNAEDLLKNFSEGIRENSDGLNDLLVRMRLTGQDQAVARQMAKSMLELTGKDITAVDRLSKNTIKLSNDYVISSENLIHAIDSLKSVMDTPSVFGLSDELAGVSMELRAMAKGLGEEDLTKTLGLIFDDSLESIPFKINAGINDAFKILADQSKSDSQRAIATREIISKAANFIEKNLKVQQGDYKVNLTKFQFDRWASADRLTALLRSNKLLEKSNDLTDQMRAGIEEYGNTAENITAETLNFYKTTTANFYPMVIDYLGGLTRSLAGAGIGGSVGALGTIFGLGRFLGPIGAIAGTAIGAFLPQILNKLNGTENTNIFREQLEESKKTRKATQSVDSKTKDQNESKQEVSQSSQYLQTAAQSLSDIVSMMNNSQYNNQIRILERQVSELEKMNKALRTSNNKGF